MAKQKLIKRIGPTLVVMAFCLSVLSAAPVRVAGQSESSGSAEAATPAGTVFTKQDNSPRIAELKTLYQQLVEDYTEKYRIYSLNKAQWESLQTLRSLEEAVMATTAVLEARDRTMITYFELLTEVLDQTNGIELSLKSKSKDQLTTRILWLRQHQAGLAGQPDRNRVNQQADDFTAQAETMVLEAHRALMLIRLGQLQTTFDRSTSLYQRILDRNEANRGTPTLEVQRQRAYEQVDLLKTEIQNDLRAAREALDPATAAHGREIETYGDFVSILETPYSKTSQFHSYLLELAHDKW